MAVLTDTERQTLWARYMSEVSARDPRETVAVTKSDLRAAVDAIDQWVDDNAASFNSAIPVAARTALTARQKAELLMFVIRRRFEVA